MNVSVILNQQAGTAARNEENVTAEALHEVFSAAGFTAEIALVPPEQIEARITLALRARPEAIFVGGGDGTVSATARELAGTGIALGILPLGTLNHFAKDLGLPLDWRETVAALARGEVREVDLAEVNGHLFINNCSVGAYADAVRQRDALRRASGHGKWFAMTIATLRVFRRLRRTRLRLQTDTADLALRSPFLVVANNRYCGNILARSLRERLDAGELWIYTTRAHRHFTLLRMLWQALTRDLGAAEQLETHATAEATVYLPGPAAAVAVDGEILKLETPLRFRIRPRALKVLVPAPANTSAA
jgi:diacylglycerol kinase family enzyme